jgi:uncharacterized membrane protein YuzA (DUF378 family)
MDIDDAVTGLRTLAHYGLGVAALNGATDVFLEVDFVGQLAGTVPYLAEITYGGALVGLAFEFGMEDPPYPKMLGDMM